MREITVVSLGPGAPELMTLQAVDALTAASRVVLRTARHGCAQALRDRGVVFTDLDGMYDQAEDFDRLNAAIADRLWAQAPLCYALADATQDETVRALERRRPTDGRIRLLAGVSLAGSCACHMPGGGSGLRILPAIACENAWPNPEEPLLITEVDSLLLAGQVKLWLMNLYGEGQLIRFFPPAQTAERASVELPLFELDRQKSYDHTACVYVSPAPLSARSRFCFHDLARVMDILRGPGGCPWDRQQTHDSLKPYLIEEAYEALAAIETGDPERMADELGDVLLQVVFHANIGKSHGAFDLYDITSAICGKMIYRHAHIFGDAHCDTAEEVLTNWEKLKQKEKGLRSQAEAMVDVPQGMPALMRAHKVQGKAARVGFDWDNPSEALAKVYEEADEVRAELAAGRDPGEELGDLLFSCVNVARLCKCQPELLLQGATEKFIRRFQRMENLIKRDGKALEHLTLSEMDVYWEQGKALEYVGSRNSSPHL